MKRGAYFLALAVLASAGAASAEVRDANPQGFTSKHEVTTTLSPADAYARFARIANWWDGAHSYSGKAPNLSIDMKPGGCWCEALADGGFIEHMRLIYAQPGQTLRFQGGLGPIQQVGGNGILTASFKAAPGGSVLTWEYVVRGLTPEQATAFAAPVDRVMGEQIRRLATPPSP